MKVKTGTYFWLFVAVVFVLVGAWKCCSVLGEAQLALGTEKDQIYGWITALVLAVAFLIWRCYRFVEEKKTVEFLAKERRRNEEIERRIRLEKAERDRKWYEENRVRA